MTGVPAQENLFQKPHVNLGHAQVLKQGSNLAMTGSPLNLDQSIPQDQATIEILNLKTCALFFV